MTKKLLFVLAAATTLFFSCNKQEIEVTETGVTEYVGLVVRVSVPKTKFAYTDEGASGLDLTLLNNKDRLIAYFRNSGGSMLGSAIPMNLDPSTLSIDKKGGTFKAESSVEIPEDATSIFFYLDNEDNGLYSLTEASIDNLKTQSGTLEDVAKHQVIVGNTDVASLTTDGAGNKVADISFEYKTSVLKFAITFPDGVVPTADDGTTITITDSDVYNSVRVAWGNPHSSASLNSKGAISFHPASVSGQVATAYVTVWGGSEFNGATMTAKVGDLVLESAFDAAAAAVAGNMHNVIRTITSVPSISKWVADDASEVDFLGGLTVDTNDDTWISYNSSTGKVSFTENTTGKPRSGEITFTNGSSVEITQISVDDFKGDWTFKSKNFAGKNKIGLTSNSTASTAVNFGAPVGTESLYDEDTGLTLDNNIGIRGLFGSKDAADAAVMNAALRLDRDKKIVEFYLFFDARKAQATTTNDASYPYVMFLPEFGASFIGSAYNFCPFPLGTDQNYGYTEMAVSADAEKLKLTYGSSNKWKWGNTGDMNGKYVCGISICVSSSATPSLGTMRGANDAASYEYIYQANHNTDTATGFFFEK